MGAIFVAAALLTAIGVTVLPGSPGEQVSWRIRMAPVGPAVPGGAAHPDDALVGVDAPEDDGPRFDAWLVQFVDRDHGFALTATCPGSERPCSYGLAVSADGGRSYQHRVLPLAKIPPLGGYSADLYAVTARTVVIEADGQWWVSLDAGRTWRLAPDSVGRNVAGIPAVGRLYTGCADTNCENRELSVIDPETGLRSQVPNVPLAQVHGSSESTIAPDGTRWISGIVRGGDPALATTRDGGRTWSVSRFPKPDKLLNGPRMVIGPGSLRYAVFTVQRSDAKNGFGPLYASSDAGRTWTRVPGGEGRPASILGAMVRPDGRLLIDTELNGPMISADGGRTFARADIDPGLSDFTDRGGMITAMKHDGTYSTSLDGGMSWSPAAVPAP